MSQAAHHIRPPQTTASQPLDQTPILMHIAHINFTSRQGHHIRRQAAAAKARVFFAVLKSNKKRYPLCLFSFRVLPFFRLLSDIHLAFSFLGEGEETKR